MRILFALLLVLANSAHAAERVEVSRLGFQCVGGAESVRLPKNLAGVRALGPITSEETVRVEEWDGYKAIEKQIRFKGMAIQVVTFTNEPERYSIASVVLESSAWSLSPFRVGDPAAPHLRRLGVKESMPNAIWRFSGESETLEIEARAGKLHRVVYECYTG